MSADYLKTIISLVGISTIAAISRSILSEDRRSLRGFFRATFLALFVGGITEGLLQGYTFSPETNGAIVGLCAFVADDILLAIVGALDWIRQDPGRLLNIILNRRSGD